MTRQTDHGPIDTYIAQFPPETAAKLQALRETIQAAAPEASEKIRYGMPTFYLRGNLVHFAAQKAHIGFYPAPSGIAAFQEALKPYKSSKGAVQFPLEGPLPLELVARIVRYRLAENLEAAAAKDHAKKK